MRRVPYSKQSITEEDIDAVVDALRSERLTQGPLSTEFECAVAELCGANYAVAVSNGSMALIAACLALEAGPGDVVWTTPNTFVATANAALHCGADIDFVDIDPETGNMSAASLEQKLAAAEKKGNLPKIIIPVHFAGLPCDLAAISALSKRYGFHVIEDATHALGARYCGKRIGGGDYSEMTIFSFHPVKSLTTGEGGMILTDDFRLYQRLRDVALQGIVRDTKRLANPDEGDWYYEQQVLGFNMRLTELQAALGLSQLRRLSEFLVRRREIALRYHELLSDLPISLPQVIDRFESAWHLYVIRLEENSGMVKRKSLVGKLAEMGIGTQVHYIPVHTQPYFKRLGFNWGDFPEAEKHYKKSLSLPLYPDLTNEDQGRVVKALRSLL